MDKILLIFFIKRFALIFMIILITLSVKEYLKGDAISIATFSEPVIWALICSLIASSISAYWAYRKRCKMVYKE